MNKTSTKAARHANIDLCDARRRPAGKGRFTIPPQPKDASRRMDRCQDSATS